MTCYHTGLILASLGVFIKNLRLDFSKPLEDRKPSQNFTIIFHLQYLVLPVGIPLSPRSSKCPKSPEPARKGPSLLAYEAGSPVKPVARPVFPRGTL